MNTRLFFIGLLSFLTMGFSAAGQDIIHTREGKAIEAKVLEISDTSISYKLFNNLEGPTFIMASEKVLKIAFENGTEYAFEVESGGHSLPADASLAELTAEGNNVYLVFEDQSGTFDEKDEYLREYIKKLTPWNLVNNRANADFILHVTGYSKRTARSYTSDTYFLTAKIQRTDGTEVWTGKTVSTFANVYNGFRAVRAVSRELVEEVLMTDLQKDKKKGLKSV